MPVQLEPAPARPANVPAANGRPDVGVHEDADGLRCAKEVRILVIDDDEDICRVVEAALCTHDFQIRTVSDPAEVEGAVRLYRELLADALESLPAGVHKLAVLPDGPLHRLPLEALRPAPQAPPGTNLPTLEPPKAQPGAAARPDGAAVTLPESKFDDSGTSFADLARQRGLNPSDISIGTLTQQDLGDRGAAVFALPQNSVTPRLSESIPPRTASTSRAT